MMKGMKKKRTKKKISRVCLIINCGDADPRIFEIETKVGGASRAKLINAAIDEGVKAFSNAFVQKLNYVRAASVAERA